MRRLFAVYGAGGCGRGIMPLLREERGDSETEFVFIDDEAEASSVNDHDIWSWERFLGEAADEQGVCLAIANSRVRERLFDRCSDAGIDVIGARAANVVEMDDVAIGQGALLSPFVTMTSNIRIGRGFHANL